MDAGSMEWRKGGPIPIAVIASALLALAAAGAAAALRPGPVPGSVDAQRLVAWWVVAAAAWAALGWLAGLLAASVAPQPAPTRQGGPIEWRAVGVILLVATAARVIVLLGGAAVLSDDVHRYVVDGEHLADGSNPYLERPADRRDALEAGSEPRWSGELSRLRLVNNPELHTIYLPTSQWLFGGSAVARRAAGLEATLALRIGAALADVGAVVLLLVLLRRRERSPWWAALYAWHPLAVVESAGSGHQDAVGIALMLLALVLLGPAAWRFVVACAVIAAATMVKPVVAPLAIFAARTRSWSVVAAGLVAGVACAAVLAAPLLLADGGRPIGHLGETATRFTEKWAHFGSAHALVESASARVLRGATQEQVERVSRGVCGVLLALAAVVIWRARQTPAASMKWLLLAMILLSTTVHPWYVLWVLALVPLAFDRATWLFSLTVVAGYAVLLPDVGWGRLPATIVVLAYAPVYAVLLAEVVVRRRSIRQETLE